MHLWKGYVRQYIDRKLYYVHRLVMEELLGRRLKKEEEVHHIDDNRANNDPKNLELLTKAKNRKKYPNVGYQKHSDETKRRIGLANKGKRTGIKANKETRKKLSESLKRYWRERSDEKRTTH